MADQLTAQQQAAVDNRGGRLLVSAAAGSGKTKVLVDRLMKYLTDPTDSANIDDFLIITFTKAAAAELRSKIASKLSEMIAEQPDNRHLQRQLQRLYMTQISTVHAFCAALLRKYAYRLDIGADFRVAEENEAAQLRLNCMSATLEDAMNQLSENEDLQAFWDSHGIGRNDDNLVEILLKVYDSAMCHVDPADWLNRCAALMETKADTDLSQTPWGEYVLQRTLSDVRMYIPVFQRCLVLAESMPSETKLVQLLRDTLLQLERLCSIRTWDELYYNKQIDFGRISFTKKADPAVSEQIKAVRTTAIKSIRSALEQCTDLSANLVVQQKDAAAAVRGMTFLVKAFSEHYDREKRRRRVLDYADLEQRVLDLLMGKGRNMPTALAKEVEQSYREVMVDEYQDANAVQDSIYMALTHVRHNCFMVGDVKQSIYQFRLADPGIFLEKYHAYEPAETAEDLQGRKIVLSSNFRSGGEILSAANSVFEICMSPQVGGLHYGSEEALREGVSHVPLGEPAVELYAVQVEKDTYEEEAACVAKRIAQLLDGTHMIREKDHLRPICPGDIAILLRSPKTNGEYFVRQLAKYGIRCTGGSTNLLDQHEVQVLRSVLQVINNPQLDIPLAAALLSPAFGLSADDLACIRKNDRYCSLFDALTKSDLEAAKQAVQIMKQLRAAAPMMTVSALIEEVFAQTHVDSVFASMPNGELCAENLNLFCYLATEFDGLGAGSLALFLEHLELLEKKGVSAADSGSDGCVQIVSIHSSKGLEYPVVVLAGLSKSFNTDGHRAQVLCHKELGIGVDGVDHLHRVRYATIAKKAVAMKLAEDDLSEEMRILYVAMTRARDRLIMSYASLNLQQQLQQIVQMDSVGCHQHVIRQTGNMGRWVLLAALRRTEAGELFALAGVGSHSRVSEHPWLIRVVQKQTEEICGKFAEERQNQLSDRAVSDIQKALAFGYSHAAATNAPSKVTATQLKGRQKDMEAAENASVPPERQFWRKPGGSSAKAIDRGNAMHASMQHLSFSACEDEQSIRHQLDDLKNRGVMTQEQIDLLDIGQLVSFFQTPVGQQLCRHPNVIREFKFSILDDGALYDSALCGEQILLQGVVDCAMIDDDGLVIIDFKTDRVDEHSLSSAVERYRSQVDAYARSLSRIFEKPVKKKLLYFFAAGSFAQL